jgi:hypothetical protein
MNIGKCITLLALVVISQVSLGETIVFPSPTDPTFCQVVQQYVSNTAVISKNVLFTDMSEYRSSKPMVNPLQTFQVVQYSGQLPIMVSCKLKGAAHIRSAYGENAAGEQRFCPAVAQELQQQAVAELREAGATQAAAVAAGFVVDNTEPYITGQSYLSDFQLSYLDDKGVAHLSSPGLFQNYDSWVRWIIPERLAGQVYCHLATPAYMKALATGAMAPGVVVTAVAEAPVTPQ